MAEDTRRNHGVESRPPAGLARTHGLIYRGPGRRAWEERPVPGIEDQTDAIVRITTSTICGTDLRILGHEGVGVVTEVGSGVSIFRPGERVLYITITTRLVDTATTPMLLKAVQSGRLQSRRLVTHRFALDDIMHPYDTFEYAAREDALKVVLANDASA